MLASDRRGTSGGGSTVLARGLTVTNRSHSSGTGRVSCRRWRRGHQHGDTVGAMSEPEPEQVLREPTFALTLDTELIWGSFDHTSPVAFERSYPDIRGTIEAILRLLERYELAATWAVIGHLFLESCSRDERGVAHPELVHPAQSWRPGDWYDADPCTDRERDPLWYGRDVLDLLQGASVPQEIDCHSFAHALYGDPAFTREAAVADLSACVAVARERGIELRSLVFPRNSEGCIMFCRSTASGRFAARWAWRSCRCRLLGYRTNRADRNRRSYGCGAFSTAGIAEKPQAVQQTSIYL